VAVRPVERNQQELPLKQGKVAVEVKAKGMATIRLE